MTFQIPDKDKLGQFSIAGLQDLRSQAENEFKTIVASVTAETVTKEQVDPGSAQEVKDAAASS